MEDNRSTGQTKLSQADKGYFTCANQQVYETLNGYCGAMNVSHEHIKGFLQKIQQFDNNILIVIQRLKQELIKLVEMLSSFIKTTISTKLVCHQCNRNLAYPFFQCMLCSSDVFVCTQCYKKQQLINHLNRNHTFALINLPTQIIKFKIVQTIELNDLKVPNSFLSSKKKPNLQKKQFFQVENIDKQKHIVQNKHIFNFQDKKIEIQEQKKEQIYKQQRPKQTLQQQKQVTIKDRAKSRSNKLVPIIRKTPLQDQQKKSPSNSYVNRGQKQSKSLSMSRRSNNKRQQKLQAKILVKPKDVLSKKRKEEKLQKLRSLLVNRTEEQIQKYMRDQYQNLTYKDVADIIRGKAQLDKKNQ